MKNMIPIGLGALALVGALFAYSHNNKRTPLSRQQVIDTLKNLRK